MIWGDEYSSQNLEDRRADPPFSPDYTMQHFLGAAPARADWAWRWRQGMEQPNAYFAPNPNQVRAPVFGPSAPRPFLEALPPAQGQQYGGYGMPVISPARVRDIFDRSSSGVRGADYGPRDRWSSQPRTGYGRSIGDILFR